MKDDDISPGSSRRLAELLRIEPEEPKLWNPSDLASIFAHQMQAKLLGDLERLESVDTATLTQIVGGRHSSLITFHDLLQHPAPPIRLLQLVKDFARSRLRGVDASVPNDVASVLYYLSIALALLRHGRRITGLDDAGLRQGLAWVTARKWVDSDVRRVCEECLTKIAPNVT